MDEKLAILALQKLKGIDLITKRRLLDTAQGVTSIFEGNIEHHDPKVRNSIMSFASWDEIERDVARVINLGAEVITILDKEYPYQLRQIPDPPLALCRKGGLKFGTDTLAIVGSRKASFESINMAEKIAQTLASLGVTVVSGLARGVDAAAHRGALRERGKTVGVLGCGIDICYPSENKTLFEKIGREGCMLTEYFPGELPLQHHFPARNRIIAGLSKGVLVVEASQRSGSLITARLGLEYGREVMAVPGSVFDEGYRGANSLIKQGARLIESIEDIITTSFPGLTWKENKQVDLDGDERYIYGIVGAAKVHIDEVIEKSGLETRRVMAILTNLELKELIRAAPGGFYLRTQTSS